MFPVTYKSLMATLWQHPNGMFYIRHSKGRVSLKKLFPNVDPEKLKQKRVANQLFNTWKRDRKDGRTALPNEHITPTRFFKFCTEFLEYAESAYPDSTYKLFTQALNKAKASWGDIKLDKITPKQVDTLLTDMRASGLAPATVNKNYRHLKAALRKAMDWQYLIPFKFPRQDREEKKVRYLSHEEFKKLLKAIKDDEFKLLVKLAAYSGLRSGEIIRLQWSDIDNPEGHIRVSSRQKNRTESRIPISPKIRAMLDLMPEPHTGKVFRFNSVEWVSHKFKAYATDTGLEDTRFHDLRHTFGSWLAMSGVPIKTIQELMRHKSITSTMVYAHLSPDHLQDSIDRLDLGED